MPRVAFQGELGAYSEDALVQLWPDNAEPIPKREFRDVAAAVESGEAELGLLPVENTLAGSVVDSYDTLAEHESLWAVAESTIPIHHCVLGVPGATLDQLVRVESHPVALAQCGAFLRAHPHIASRAAYDTAGAARAVAELGDPRVAAIAGRAAAVRFSLDILAAQVEDRPDNQTRFLAIARAPARLSDGVPARTTLILTTANAPGTLYHVLQPVAEHGLNLSKLESRPTGEPWSYRFFVDIEHPAGDPRLEAAIEAIATSARSLRILGTYRRAAALAGPARSAPHAPVVSARRPERVGEDPATHTSVTVIGLGVIGGSLARALGTHGVEARAFAASPDDRTLATRAGIQVTPSLAEAARATRPGDVVVMAVPPAALDSVLRELCPLLPPEAVVIHATGLQTQRALGLDDATYARVIGAHPLAGSHESGFDASRADLFHGCTVSIEERAGVGAEARRRVEWLWTTAGAARLDYRTAAEHDRWIAWISHLPQLVATAAAAALAESDVDPRTLGPGGRGLTRLAASPFHLWREILERAPVDAPLALRATEAMLATLRDSLEARDLERLETLWSRAAVWRRSADD
jgi:prephenate dehydratase/prephenate dehydrogenase